MSTQPEPFSYDEVPYPSVPFAQTHPNRLATIATLMGMTPAPVATCRVLELGCSRADNLIPLALELPDAELYGIDLSARQIEEGAALVRELGIGNLRLEQRDIMALGEDIGQFDYIIAHGVYSWIPAPVRDRLMQICARHLRPNGVAFVSYNTYPGWHMNRVVRDLLLFHTRATADPHARIDDSRRMVDLLSRCVPDEIGHYRAIFRRVHDQIEEAETLPAWLFHEFLEDVNEPQYFHEFAAHAATHGLRYLAESNLWEMQPEHLSEQAVRALAQLQNDLIRREQYLDFLSNRMFRQTLLCHGATELDRNITWDRITDMHLAAHLECPKPDADLHGGETFPFRHEDRGIEGATDHPLTKAALLTLSQDWPATYAFDELCQAAHERLSPGAADGAPDPADVRELAENLTPLYGAGAIELHVHPPQFARSVGERPVASPWARHRVRCGEPLTNLRHHGVSLDLLERRLLPLLDGTRTRSDLAGAMVDALGDDGTLLVADGMPVDDHEARMRILGEAIDGALASLARRALLVA